MDETAPQLSSHPVFDVARLTDWVEGLLCAAGTPPGDATLTAELLMFSQVRGVVSHGLSLLGPYARRSRDGGTNCAPRPRSTVHGAVCVIDADDAIGSVCAMQAVESATELARAYGIGLAAVRNANHVGALAFYVQRLAQDGLVAIMASNADPSMASPSGGSPVLGSNPLAIAVPDPQGRGRIVLDMATTAVAHGRIVAALRQDQSIPGDWAVDADGLPTTEPAAAMGGALLPAAGYKGFGLAFMIDVLAAGLSQGRIGRDVVPLKTSTDQPQGVSVLVIAIDPEACSGSGYLSGVVDALEDQIAVGGGESPLSVAPGVPEARRAAQNERQVAVDAPLVDELLKLAEEFGVPASLLLDGVDSGIPDPVSR